MNATELERVVDYVLKAPKANYCFPLPSCPLMWYGGVRIEYFASTKEFWVITNIRYMNKRNRGGRWGLHIIVSGSPQYSKLRLFFYRVWLEKVHLAMIGE